MGCFSTPPHRSSSLNYNISDEFKKMQILRKLLLPSEYNIDREAVIDEVTEAFSVELRKIGSREVVGQLEIKRHSSPNMKYGTRDLSI